MSRRSRSRSPRRDGGGNGGGGGHRGREKGGSMALASLQRNLCAEGCKVWFGGLHQHTTVRDLEDFLRGRGATRARLDDFNHFPFCREDGECLGGPAPSRLRVCGLC